MQTILVCLLSSFFIFTLSINEKGFLKERSQVLSEKLSEAIAKEDFALAANLKKDLETNNEKIESLKAERKQSLPIATDISKIALAESNERIERYKKFKVEVVASSITILSRIISIAANAGAQYVAIRGSRDGLEVYVDRSTSPNCDPELDVPQVYSIGKSFFEAIAATLAAMKEIKRKAESRKLENSDGFNGMVMNQMYHRLFIFNNGDFLKGVSMEKNASPTQWLSYPANLDDTIPIINIFQGVRGFINLNGQLHAQRNANYKTEIAGIEKELVELLLSLESRIEFQIADHTHFLSHFDADDNQDIAIATVGLQSVGAKAMLIHELLSSGYTVGVHKNWPVVIKLYDDGYSDFEQSVLENAKTSLMKAKKNISNAFIHTEIHRKHKVLNKGQINDAFVEWYPI